MKRFWIPFTFLILSFYSLGAGLMDSFAIYHSWLYIGAKEFPRMHQETSVRIQLFLVFPMLVLTGFCVLMFWYRPRSVKRKLVWIALSSLLLGWISSALIQIPLQMQLSQNKNLLVLQKLIESDWIRIAAWIIYIVTLFAMAKAVKNSMNKAATGYNITDRQ